FDGGDARNACRPGNGAGCGVTGLPSPRKEPHEKPLPPRGCLAESLCSDQSRRAGEKVRGDHPQEHWHRGDGYQRARRDCGRRICGWSLGDNRMRACVWDRTDTTWKAVALPMHAQLGSPTVAISDNGKQVASIDGTVACLWTQEADGKWSRRVISRPGALAPRSVNNSGMVAGVRSDLNGQIHAVIHSHETGYKQLQEP